MSSQRKEGRSEAFARRVAAGEDQAAVAADLGLSRGTVQAIMVGLSASNQPTLASRVRHLETELAATRGRLEHAEAIARVVHLAEGLPPPAPPAWLDEREHTGSVGVPTTIWSDWHLGEVVCPAETRGYNSFNQAVAEQRAGVLVQKMIRLSRLWAGDRFASIPGAVVVLGGDMVSGDIHDELARTNESQILEVVLQARDLLVAALEKVADAFGRVFVPCVAGNHGRIDKKKPAKKYTKRNFDWLIYRLVERHFEKDNRVQFLIPDSNTANFTVFGHRYTALHGDDLGVRGGDGIIGALGPIMRGVMKVGAQQAELGAQFDTLLLGHWHQYLPLRRVIVNGALKGWDEYAHTMLRAVPAPPSQALWFTAPRRGITTSCEIFLDGRAETAVRSAETTWLQWRE